MAIFEFELSNAFAEANDLEDGGAGILNQALKCQQMRKLLIRELGFDAPMYGLTEELLACCHKALPFMEEEERRMRYRNPTADRIRIVLDKSEQAQPRTGQVNRG